MSSAKPVSPVPGRAAIAARAAVIRRLEADHREFRNAWRRFRRLDPAREAEQADELVQHTVSRLRRHAQFEQAHLYLALRAINDEQQAIDRAHIEHESIDALLDRLQSLRSGDERFAALFEVVCEHMLHHIRHEEAELFPQLARAPLDWPALLTQIELPEAPAQTPDPRVESTADPLPADGEVVALQRGGERDEQVPVLHSSPVPMAEPVDDLLPPDAVRARPDTPAERRAARRSTPIK